MAVETDGCGNGGGRLPRHGLQRLQQSRHRPARTARKGGGGGQALGYLGPDPKARLLRSGKFNAIGVCPSGRTGAWPIRSPIRSMSIPARRRRGVRRGWGQPRDRLPDRTRGAGIGRRSSTASSSAGLSTSTSFSIAKLRRLPMVVVDVDPGPEFSSVRVDARRGRLCRGPPPSGPRPPPFRHHVLPARQLGPARFPAPASPARRRLPACRPMWKSSKAMPQALAEAGLSIDDGAHGAGPARRIPLPPACLLDLGAGMPPPSCRCRSCRPSPC